MTQKINAKMYKRKIRLRLSTISVASFSIALPFGFSFSKEMQPPLKWMSPYFVCYHYKKKIRFVKETKRI